jgi:hypothetical protein
MASYVLYKLFLLFLSISTTGELLQSPGGHIPIQSQMGMKPGIYAFADVF